MSYTLHVANLQPWLTSADLARKFRCFGIVISADIIADEQSGKSECHGFVEMASQACAEHAIDGLDASMYEGQEISVQSSRRDRADA